MDGGVGGEEAEDEVDLWFFPYYEGYCGDVVEEASHFKELAAQRQAGICYSDLKTKRRRPWKGI